MSAAAGGPRFDRQALLATSHALHAVVEVARRELAEQGTVGAQYWLALDELHAVQLQQMPDDRDELRRRG